MLNLILKNSKQFCREDKSLLTIQYYLVQSFYQNKPIYGIQVQSYQDNNPQYIHAESIFHISYSKSYVCSLIHLCMKHTVTPSDLFSSIDILIDTIEQ